MSLLPGTCKFPMVLHSVPFLHRRCRSKTNFYIFSYDKISLKFCASFRFFLAVFMEKFPKIRYLIYVRRGIVCVHCDLDPGDMTLGQGHATPLVMDNHCVKY